MGASVGTVIYEGELSLREARQKYFQAWGFSEGGYEDAWVTLQKIGGIAIGFPNTAARRRAVKLHDLHHVLTGYRADWIGEAEIGAWEVGASCHRHWAAWILNLLALQYGLWIAPRKVLRAIARGRRSATLYRSAELDESLLDERVSAIRARLHIPDEAKVRVEIGDVVALAGWYAVGILIWAWPWALLGAFWAAM